MKALRIDFAPRRPRGFAALFTAAIIGLAFAGFQWAKVFELQAQLKMASAKAYAAQTVAAVPTPAGGQESARPSDAHAVAAMAEFDWAGVLKAIETIREPGVRVSSASFDARSRSGKVEIELRDAMQIKGVLSALNAGEPGIRWALVQVQGAAPGKPAGATIEWVRP